MVKRHRIVHQKENASIDLLSPHKDHLKEKKRTPTRKRHVDDDRKHHVDDGATAGYVHAAMTLLGLVIMNDRETKNGSTESTLSPKKSMHRDCQPKGWNQKKSSRHPHPSKGRRAINQPR